MRANLLLATALMSISFTVDGETLSFDFEGSKSHGWTRVVGDIRDYIRPTTECDAHVSEADTGESILVTSFRHGGILESPVFSVKGSEATFLLGGGGSPHAWVSLHLESGEEVKRTFVPVKRADQENPWKLKPVTLDVSEFTGKRIFLRVVAEPVGYSLSRRGVGSLFQESFVVLDNFRVDGSIDEAATKRRNQHRDKEQEGSLNAVADKVRDIVFAIRTADRDPHWYANIGHWIGDPDRKLYHPGAQLCRLNTHTGEMKILLDDPQGGIRDPQVHYDGKKILFSYRKGESEHFNLYEINIDGTGLIQLTDGAYDDIEPSYFPNGRIVFVSTRCKRWVPCYFTEVAVLHSCNADGSGIRMLSPNVEHENTPWPMPDGSILYTRWEYIERSVLQFHHLWSAKPDGTQQKVFYGNMHPGYVMIDAKPIPDTRKVASIFVPGHSRKEHIGTITIVDPQNGPDDQSAIKRVGWTKMERDPYPIGNDGFLLAKFGEIMLMDYEGRTRTIWKLPEEMAKQGVMVHEPRPIEPKPRERMIPDQMDLTKDTGILMLENVYEGRNMKGIEPGQIKELMVLEALPKSLNVSNGSEPISRFAHNHERILGTVPVEADGSACFEVPAMRALFLVALDKDKRAVKRMQSFLTVQPGEVAGCVGCHEDRHKTPRPGAGIRLATQVPPGKIKPIKDVPDVFDFPRDIQPILNKHCVGCHGYEKTKKGGPFAGRIILTGDHGPKWSHSYSTLLGGFLTSGSLYGNNPPYATGSGGSKLMKLISGEHNGVKLSGHEKKMLRLWMDTGCMYAGTLAAEGSGMIYSQIGRQEKIYRVKTYSSWFQMPEKWPDALAAATATVEKNCMGCHQGEAMLDLDLTRDSRFWKAKQGRGKPIDPERALNLSRPESSLFLLAPLAKSAGGFQLCNDGKKDGSPILHDKGPEYQTILDYIRVLHEAQNTNKRFNMPGFRPPPYYVRQMKRYGVIPADYNRSQPLDVYAADRKYWESFWYRPESEPGDR